MTNLNCAELKNAFDEILRYEQQKADVADNLKSIYARLKSDGQDIDAIKKIVSDQKKELKKVLQVEEMIIIYRDALGIVTMNVEGKANESC